MTIFIIQLLNSFFYAAVLFLIAAGLSLIYGVMRIVNLAHGTLYALGAYVSAWVVGGAVGHAASGTLGLAGLLLLLPVGAVAIAVVGAVIEPTLLRPLYRRPEEYHLLVTFGLLMILEDAMKFLFGGTPLTAGSIMDHMSSIPIGRLLYPTYNLFVIIIGLIAAFGLWGSFAPVSLSARAWCASAPAPATIPPSTSRTAVATLHLVTNMLFKAPLARAATDGAIPPATEALPAANPSAAWVVAITSFAGTVDEVPDEEVINAIKSVPCHY